SNPLRTGVRPVLGIRPYLEEPLRQALGAAAGRLVGAESLGPRGLPASGPPPEGCAGGRP
ncbi:hypothetical protein J7E97_31850, partial [Streptomyces sp. ISL-66]|nr:hypothetical protein [Streptomyces sp. ISL-66]